MLPAARREKRAVYALAGQLDEATALLAGIEPRSLESASRVRRSDCQELLPRLQNDPLHRPERFIDQQREHRFGGFGQHLDRLWIALASRNNTPRQAPRNPPPAPTPATIKHRTTKSLFRYLLARPCRQTPHPDDHPDPTGRTRQAQS